MNVIHAAELLVEKIKKEYKDDIAVVVIMGSHIYNETHSRSDLDMYYVPNTKRGFNLGFTFILEGIGFDFWPISWERLERIANHDEKITAIITEGKIFYYSTEEDLKRFNQVKQKALDVSDQNKFIKQASNNFKNVYRHYWDLNNASTLSNARKYAINIIYTVTYSLALLNGITIKRGRKKLKQEILNMPLVPDNFSELYDSVFMMSDIDTLKKTYERLIKNTEALISQEQAKINSLVPFNHALDGFYEELINFYNKIYRSYEINDTVTALYASVELTNEVESVLKETGVPADLPDLIGAYDPNDLQKLCEAAKDHQIRFVELLTSNGVNIREFSDFSELETYLNTL